MPIREVASLRYLSLVPLLILFAGCSLLGSSDELCDEALGDVDPGEFALLIESSEGCMVERDDDARFWHPVRYSDEAPATFLLYLEGAGERATRIYIGAPGDDRPEEGTYPLADLTTATPYLGLYEFREGRFSIGAYISNQYGYVFSETGRIVITRSDKELVEGEVEATLFREGGYEDEPQEVTIKGRFKATPNDELQYTSF